MCFYIFFEREPVTANKGAVFFILGGHTYIGLKGIRTHIYDRCILNSFLLPCLSHTHLYFPTYMLTKLTLCSIPRIPTNRLARHMQLKN